MTYIRTMVFGIGISILIANLSYGDITYDISFQGSDIQLSGFITTDGYVSDDPLTRGEFFSHVLDYSISINGRVFGSADTNWLGSHMYTLTNRRIEIESVPNIFTNAGVILESPWTDRGSYSELNLLQYGVANESGFTGQETIRHRRVVYVPSSGRYYFYDRLENGPGQTSDFPGVGSPLRLAINSNIPEPSTVGILALGGLLFSLRRKRQLT